LRWLETIFSPWAAELASSETIVISSQSSRIRRKYEAWTKKAPTVPAAQLVPLDVQYEPLPAAPGRALALPVASADEARLLLANALPHWSQLDLSAIPLPEDYPPRVPVFQDEHLQPLTDAMTDVFCRLCFGDPVRCNTGYRLVGRHLYRLGLTQRAFQLLPTATPSELDVRFSWS
jgi:hypothetical protein